MNWHETPFLRFLPFLVLGILMAFWWDHVYIAYASGAILFFFIILLFKLKDQSTEHLKRRRFGFVWSGALMLLGYLLGFLHQDLHLPRHFHFLEQQQDGYFMAVIRQVRNGEKNLRLEMDIRCAAVSQTDSLVPAAGRLLVFLPADTQSAKLSAGNILAFRGKPTAFNPPLNPKAFDFGRYMRLKGVHFQCAVRNGNWKPLSSSSRSHRYSWTNWTTHLMRYCLGVFRRHLPGDDEYAIGSALVLGYREDVRPEVYTAYSETGAIHVLSVSGLHVGLVYIGLGFLVGFLKRKKNRPARILHAALLLAGVWVFAVFTGASPSALRAATMFSFIIVGRSINRHSNIYNTLAASAFCLIALNPYLLFDIGFQLSYLAVVGIVFFQDPLYRFWYIRNRIGRSIWKLTTVGIGAQLTTFPLTLYIFHQFPVYFWLSGLIVVPLASFILPLGILLLATDGIPFLGENLGILFHFLIRTMNQVIFLIQQMPGALISGLWIGIYGLILGYFITGNLMWCVAVRQFRPVYWSFAALFLGGLLVNIRAWQQAGAQEVVIYQVPQYSVFEFFAGNSSFCLSDLALNDTRLVRAASNYKTFRNIRKTEYWPLKTPSASRSNQFFKHGPFVQFFHFTLFILEQPSSRPPPSPVELDLLLVRNDPSFDPDHLEHYFKPARVVLDGSNNRKTARLWKKACEKTGIPFHFTAEHGAFIQHL